MPHYANIQQLEQVETRLRSYPPLVFEGEVAKLKAQLKLVEQGEAFLLQGGDCAEGFADFDAGSIRDTFRLLMQMAIVLTFGQKRPVVKVGRIAGQFAKPRSADLETRGEVSLTAYRGDIINGNAFTAEARKPDPQRMEQAYFQSAATLNLLRALSNGGFADLTRVQEWNHDFLRMKEPDERFRDVVSRLSETIAFMRATGLAIEKLETVDFFTSHEALLLNYEEALVRQDGPEQIPYAGSAHMLWVGERTRQLDGAHIAFVSGIANPIGLKVGPSMDPDELMRLIAKLDPENEPGRLTLIPRLGVGKVATVLPKLVQRVKSEGRRVVWCCDPMHGNTYTTASGFKTRRFEDILHETQIFFEVHRAEGTTPGGVHFELTGRDVSECMGGAQEILENQLAEGYQTLCDPRLNASQALEFAFRLVKTGLSL